MKERRPEKNRHERDERSLRVCVDHGECSSWDIIHRQTMTKQAGGKFCGFLLIFYFYFIFFYTPFALKCEVYDRPGPAHPHWWFWQHTQWLGGAKIYTSNTLPPGFVWSTDKYNQIPSNQRMTGFHFYYFLRTLYNICVKWVDTSTVGRQRLLWASLEMTWYPAALSERGNQSVHDIVLKLDTSWY